MSHQKNRKGKATMGPRLWNRISKEIHRASVSIREARRPRKLESWAAILGHLMNTKNGKTAESTDMANAVIHILFHPDAGFMSPDAVKVMTEIQSLDIPEGYFVELEWGPETHWFVFDSHALAEQSETDQWEGCRKHFDYNPEEDEEDAAEWPEATRVYDMTSVEDDFLANILVHKVHEIEGLKKAIYVSESELSA